MSLRSEFAETIFELSDNCLSANECERFGMTWGCKADCPVFERGECKDCWHENIETFYKRGEIDKDDALVFVEKYSHKMDKEEKDSLIEIIELINV